jgi:hypothetical protein
VIAALKKESVEVSAAPLRLTSLADDVAALKCDVPHADVRFFDTGHFALETRCDEIALAIRDFLVSPSELQRRIAQAR